MVNRPQAGLDILDVIYHTVHNFPGGTAALAARMGMTVDVLRQKANVNNTQHVFHPRQLLDLMYFTGTDGVLHAMAEHMGRVVMNASPDDSDGDMHQALAQLQGHYAEVVRHTADLLPGKRSVASGDGGTLSGNDVRRVEYHVQELHAALGHLLAAMRANMRPAPKGE